MPLISIGLPIYNGENYIKAAIDSILAQTFEDFELIISDNASTDRTEDICREYMARDHRIQYFRNDKNLGASYNFNRVFQLSSSEYFMWAAHDDMYAPEFISKCVEVLKQNPEIVLCFSKTEFIDEEGNFLKYFDYPPKINSPSPSKRFSDIVINNYIVVEIFGLIRSDILKKTPLLGDYSAADKVVLGELALYGPFFEIPEYLFFHREHSQRASIIYRDLRSYTSWFAPSRANAVTFPTWRLLSEILAAINRAPVSPMEKFKCYLHMLRWIRSRRVGMLNDLVIGCKNNGKKYFNLNNLLGRRKLKMAKKDLPTKVFD